MEKNRKGLLRSLSAWVIAIGLLNGVGQAGQMDLGGQLNVTETGAATYTLPIVVPPGTAGIAPTLTLNYNSQGGNGMLGMGWSLGGLSAIYRCGRTLIQDGVKDTVNYNSNDRYCLDGQRLVAVSGAYGANGAEYRTERESFTKIISYGTAGSGPAYFKAWTKAGQIIEFGNTADSAIEAQGKTDIRAWAANKISDTKGNYLTISYTEDNANGDYRPSRIDYTGNASAALTPYNSVRFVYQSRTDITPMYQAGSVSKTMLRLANVQTYANFNGTDTLVKDYRLAYDTSAATQRSRLTSIMECAGDGVCLPATTAGWQGGNTSFAPVATTDIPTWDNPNIRNIAADVNGDGKTDFLVWHAPFNNSRYNLYLSNGNGFDPAVATDVPSWDYSAVNCQVVGDFNGDGKADLLIWHAPFNNYRYNLYLSTGNGFAPAVATDIQSYWNPNIRNIAADVNGDGKTDFLVWHAPFNNSRYNLYLSNGNGFNSAIATDVPSWDYSDINCQVAGDFNGDGKADLLMWHVPFNNYRFNLYLSTGSGFAPAAATDIQSYWNWKVRNAEGDFNGDGKTDFLVWYAPFNNNKFNAYYNVYGAPDLLYTTTTGLGTPTSLTYKPITDNTIYTKDTAAAYPYMDLQAPLYVVSSVTAPTGIGGTRSTSYKYFGAKAHLTGGGFLGFRQFDVTDTATGIKNSTVFRQDYPYQGLPTSVAVTLGTSTLKTVTNTWGFDTFADTVSPIATANGSKHHFPKLTQSVESSWDLNGTALPVVTTSNQYDIYGNATQVTVSTPDGYSKTTTNTYTNDLTNWYLGRLTRSTVTSTTP